MAKILLDRLKEQFGDDVIATSSFRGDEVAEVKPGAWKDAARFLRDDSSCQCDYFVDLSAVDNLGCAEAEKGRFEVYVIVHSLGRKHRVRLITRVDGNEPILDSLVDVYSGANWQERECYDMFGIRFRGHPDLRRILLYEEFQGHPLRKDYAANKSQPLVPYRDGTFDKLGPFLADEGMPFNRSPSRDIPGDR